MLDSITTSAGSVENFPISKRWPAVNPNILQLYSMPTPNGQKVSIMLEEIGLDYEAHKIPLNDEGVSSPEFLSLNPNNKIPAIVDPDGPGGQAFGLFESGAILTYLAEKSGKFQGTTEAERWEVQQWLMFQMAGLGPMCGQLGYFITFAGKDIEDKRPRDRYLNEVKRLLDVVERRLADRDWLAGSYSIADMAVAPWLNCIEQFYHAGDMVGLRDRKNLSAYMDRFNARPAVMRGENIPAHDW
ncbi:glutathione S-transferase N-terminal domain-containing protein [uncultured Tateyamaria sp.]|uniref:glutathione S-transferase N-terminal domain-containing protein n=1 Tax=uncultured Tateyamaria sp. TaxID=455651 RepID=UPI0026385AAF|nr:glutathione S-transferase N-terminal domain-containing protein [uncultured Tateyamaria sp.]